MSSTAAWFCSGVVLHRRRFRYACIKRLAVNLPALRSLGPLTFQSEPE